MVESNKVWVRTSCLDIAVHGKSKSSNTRALPGTIVNSDHFHWGWAKGRIIDSDHKPNDQNNLEYSEDEDIKVYIEDMESSHNHSEITLKGSSFIKGDVVMDNIYGNNNTTLGDDDDSDDGYDSQDENVDKYPDDLITLTHLHEPSVVYCLRRRYSRDKIYTSTGPILIALNPFKSCKKLYNEEIMKKYWTMGEGRMLGIASDISSSDAESKDRNCGAEDDQNLPPHVYGIADDSFRTMMMKLNESTSKSSSAGGRRRRSPASSSANAAGNSCSQSILVSGESGAGKTVTTKFIMQYLATLSKRSHHPSENEAASSPENGGKTKVDIEQQVLQSNPILESFGNARTIRNDNSSRFGKFIEIQFTDLGHLAGASIETYLLEKVRLVTQMEGERNYHIFYELLEGLSDEELNTYHLTNYTVEDFIMTNQSGTYDRRDGVSDYDTFESLVVAMDTMGFSKDEQTDIFSLVCALLHASNLTFKSITADESEIDMENEHMNAFLNLMGLTGEDLNRALCYFSIVAGREKHQRSNSKEKAEKGLLALIKTTYGALFTHVVKRVNDCIAIFHSNTKQGIDHTAAAASIGVLDIFGFESFKTNSFEQLCINYCNEALQQQFNLFVLKNEQEEYKNEGIKWSYVEFPDNQDVLDLISKKATGILSILDDQCKAPGTTDKTFINDLYQKVSRHKRFQADYRQVGARKFAIVHYAGSVEYDSEGFVEKNRDELPKEATELLLSSSNSFVKNLAEIISGVSEPKSSSTPRAKSKSKSTVGGQFSRQLQELRQKIDLTTPHYIRCLKPNDELEPENFNPLVVADQLRCAGVIEAVRVSRLGYPQRYTHSKFVQRYRILGLKALKAGNRRKPVESLVSAIVEKIVELSAKNDRKPEETSFSGIQLGKTKVFLRREAYEMIEKLRNIEMREAAVNIQKIARGYMVHKLFIEKKQAALTLQCFSRCVKARQVVQMERQIYNAIIIQKSFRRFKERKTYTAMQLVANALQRRYRGNKGRETYVIVLQFAKALIIQKNWRMHKYVQIYRKMKKSATRIQCLFRSSKSKQRLLHLKKAAKDLQNTANERDQLRSENKRLLKALNEATAKILNLEESIQNNPLEQELEDRKSDVLNLTNELQETKLLFDNEKSRASEAEQLIAAKDAVLSNLTIEHDALKEECEGKNKDIEQHLSALEVLKENFEQTKSEKDSLQNLLTSMESKAASIQKDFESTVAAKDDETALLTSRIQEFQEQIKFQCKERSTVQKSWEDATRELNRANAEILHLKETLHLKNSIEEDTLDNMKVENEELLAKVEMQSKDIENLRAVEVEKKHLESEVERKENEIQCLQRKSEEALEKLETLNAQKEEICEHLAQSKAKYNELLQNMNEENSSSNLLEDEVQSLRATISEFEVEKENLEVIVAKKEAEVVELKENLSISRKDLESLGQQLNCIKENLSKIENERDQLKAESVDLREKLDSSQKYASDNDILVSTINSLRKEVEEILSDKDKCMTQLTEVQDSLKEANARITDLREKLDESSINEAKIKAENDELQETLKKQQVDLESLRVLSMERDDLQQKIDKLREEMNITSELERKASLELDVILQNKNKNQLPSTPIYSMESSTGLSNHEEEDPRDEEISNLKDIIENLKEELTAVTETQSTKATEHEEDILVSEIAKAKEAAAGEILTLQDEVERLNAEIAKMKEGLSGSSQSSYSSPPESGDKVGRLIDSIMAKDEEIRDLRREISMLRDQLDATNISCLTDGQSHMFSRLAPVDDDDRSVISKIFNRGGQNRQQSFGVDNKDMTQLRSTNESLQNELDAITAERDDLKTRLQEEKENAERELAAFGQTLQSVDEWRRLAEKLSRENNRLKLQKDDEVPDDPFGDLVDMEHDAMEEYDNCNKEFEKVKNVIGTASTIREEKEDRSVASLERRTFFSRFRGTNKKYDGAASRKQMTTDDDDDNKSIFSSMW
jgi:myosin-5